MATLEEFNALRAGVDPEVQTELYGLMTSDPEAGQSQGLETMQLRVSIRAPARHLQASPSCLKYVLGECPFRLFKDGLILEMRWFNT